MIGISDNEIIQYVRDNPLCTAGEIARYYGIEDGASGIARKLKVWTKYGIIVCHEVGPRINGRARYKWTAKE